MEVRTTNASACSSEDTKWRLTFVVNHIIRHVSKTIESTGGMENTWQLDISVDDQTDRCDVQQF